MKTQRPTWQDWLSRLALAALLAAGALFGACDDDKLPSDTTGSGGTGAHGGTGGTGAQGGTGGTGGTGAQGGTGTGGTATGGTATGGTGTGGAPDCYMNPKTHVEIINACTDAQKIDKQSVLPLLNPDGSLPSLP